jgi:hypothetical protein
MSVGLERFKQRDAQQTEHATPEETDVLISILSAVDAQNTRLTALAEQQKKVASYVKVMDEETGKTLERMEKRLQASITQESALAPSASSTNEGVRSELHQIGLTLHSLDSALDGKQIASAVLSLKSATAQIEKTTAWNSEQSDEFVTKYEHALNSAGRAINATRDQALTAIKESASATAGAVSEKIDVAVERVHAATASAERVVDLAERLRKPLGWSAAARMALTLLPVAVVLLMGVQTVWVLVVGVRWALTQDWALWLRITTLIGMSSLVTGAGFGLWRLTVWVKSALDESSARQGRRPR